MELTTSPVSILFFSFFRHLVSFERLSINSLKFKRKKGAAQSQFERTVVVPYQIGVDPSFSARPTPTTQQHLIFPHILERLFFYCTAHIPLGYTPAIMVKRNITIAIIIIVLFLILALAGFAIWAVQNHVSFFSKKREGDEESAEEG